MVERRLRGGNGPTVRIGVAQGRYRDASDPSPLPILRVLRGRHLALTGGVGQHHRPAVPTRQGYPLAHAPSRCLERHRPVDWCHGRVGRAGSRLPAAAVGSLGQPLVAPPAASPGPYPRPLAALLVAESSSPKQREPTHDRAAQPPPAQGTRIPNPKGGLSHRLSSRRRSVIQRASPLSSTCPGPLQRRHSD